jgi:hypothetical protein
MCQRRLDVALIAFVFIAAVTLSIVSINIPSLFAILQPRFGFSLNLLLFPVVHLGAYLWRPASKILWGAAGMTATVAILGGAGVCWSGTVETVSNVHTDRLSSAYFFSVVPALAASIYLASIAWSLRKHVPYSPDAPSNIG